MTTKANMFTIKEVPMKEVPEARKRLKTLVAQAPDEWNRLTQAIANSDLKGDKALKINLEAAAGKLKGIKRPELVVLRNLKRYVRDEHIPRRIFLREGSIYVGVGNRAESGRKGRRAAA